MRLIHRLSAAAACATALAVSAPAYAATFAYTSQPAFEAALGGSFTLVNLDSATFAAFGNGWNLDDTNPALALAARGLDSIGYNAEVVSGQNGQTPTERDWLITNGINTGGAGQGGTIAFNFSTPVNGVGAFSNILGDGDGGRVRIFGGAGLTDFIAEARFGRPGDGFGGITSTQLIRSVQFTCDVNDDLRCGVYDIQFGTTGVPEPGTWALMILGFGAAGTMLRRRGTAPRRA